MRQLAPTEITFTCWGTLPPPVHGSSLMNHLTAQELKTLGRVIWADPSSVTSPRLLGRAGWRQLAAGTRALVSFALALQARGRKRAYLSISVDGLAFWRDAVAWTLATIRTDKPPVIHLHTGATGALSKGAVKRPLAAWLLRRSETWLLSERFRDALPVHSTGLVVPNGINCSGSEHDEVLTSSCTPGKGPIQLVYFSNRIPTKGVIAAINVSSQLLGQHAGALNVTFAGLPMDQLVEEALERLREKHPSEVTVLDGVDSEAKCRLLGHADVLLFPSRYPLEGAPLVLIEGLMHGAYCIVTDHAAMPEIVGTSGSVVTDEAGILDAYNAFAALSPEERQAIKLAAIEHWRRHYSAEIYRGRVAERMKAGVP